MQFVRRQKTTFSRHLKTFLFSTTYYNYGMRHRSYYHTRNAAVTVTEKVAQLIQYNSSEIEDRRTAQPVQRGLPSVQEVGLLGQNTDLQ